jgi:hypothetical protein
MVQALAAPEVVRCYFDDCFEPHLPAMCLRWPAEGRTPKEREWTLPEGVRLVGPAPQHFGVSIQRRAADTYSVRLLWERTVFNWPAVSRAQLLNTSLEPLLGALGTDLWYLLDQPLEDGVPCRAA